MLRRLSWVKGVPLPAGVSPERLRCQVRRQLVSGSGGTHILACVPFLRLDFNLEALRKLAERQISVDEVTEVFQTTPVIWIENPNPRADDSRWLIGPTGAGRFLTVVVDRDGTDDGRWHVMTAWDSTPAQIRLYRSAR